MLDITRQIQEVVNESGVTEGICTVFIPHTTAAVTINENADPDVVRDFTMEINKIVPWEDDYYHMEGNSAASLANLLMSVSQIIANSRIASYNDDMAVAGFGVGMKIVMITGILCIGFGMGVQPLLGFCVGARNIPRFKQSLKMSIILAFSLNSVLTALCLIFAKQLCGLFLTDINALSYAMHFSRILLSTSFLFGLFFVMSNTLQAMGEAVSALIINISRQGIIFIPALLIFESILGMEGLVWAQPVADVLSTTLVIILYIRAIKRLERRVAAEQTAEQEAECP